MKLSRDIHRQIAVYAFNSGHTPKRPICVRRIYSAYRLIFTVMLNIRILE